MQKINENIKSVLFDFNRTLFDPSLDILIKDTIQVLEKFSQKYKLGLISIGKQKNRESLIEELKINKYFEVIEIVEEKTGEIFKSFCRKVNSKPSEVLVIGDRVQSEIAIGNSLGMQTVWFRNGVFADVLPKDKAETPDFIITNLSDLLNT